MVSHGCYLCPHPDPNGLTHPCYSCLPQQQSPLTKPAHILIQLTLPIRPISNNRQRGKRPLPNRTTFVFRFEGNVSSGSVSNSASSPGAATQHHSTRSDQPQTYSTLWAYLLSTEHQDVTIKLLEQRTVRGKSRHHGDFQLRALVRLTLNTNINESAERQRSTWEANTRARVLTQQNNICI